MNINSAFPSNYLKAADLQGRQVGVIIAAIKMEDIGDDHKPVVYFRGKEKGLVLNKTNANMIAEICRTDETDHWVGASIILYPTKTDYQGKRVDAIRVERPSGGGAMLPPVAPEPMPVSAPNVMLNDSDIPF